MHKKVIIIGAGRSGTNMLRDTLVRFDSCDTWDCDEINYIWRYGNRDHVSDELLRSHQTAKSTQYINSAFEKIADQKKCNFVIEKTCANSLRVSYLDAVVQDAIYINIVRNGEDVVSSAFDRWTAGVEPGYLARKLKYVPIADLPYYMTRYASHRVQRLFREDNSLPSWGPVYDGMREDVKNHTIPEVCALQWKHCVERSHTQLTASRNRVLTVNYEKFVKRPVPGMKEILDFMSLTVDETTIAKAVSMISSKSVGKGRKFVDRHAGLAEIINSADIKAA